MSNIDTAKERDELVARLRKTPGWPTLGNKAADQIEHDGREIERLRDALKIIREWQWFEIEPHAGDIPDNVNAWARELDDACTQMQRVARAALNSEDTP